MVVTNVTKRASMGLCAVALSVITFVGSGVSIQLLFTNGDYNKPVALTVYSLSLSVILLAFRNYLHSPTPGHNLTAESSPLLMESGLVSLPRHHNNTFNRFSLPSASKICALGLMWFTAQLTYNISLKYISVATNSSLSSCSSVFSFIFSILLLGYPLCRAAPISAVLMCVIGVLITALNRPSPKTALAVNESVLGDIIALGSACSYGIFGCYLKLWVPDERMVVQLFGMFGIVCMAVGVPCIVVCHFTGYETFALPTWGQFVVLTANGIFGSVASDFFLSLGVILLSPLAAAVGQSLTIPLSLVVDSSILGLHTFKSIYVLGSALMFGAVVLISWDTYAVESVSDKPIHSPYAAVPDRLPPLMIGSAKEGSESDFTTRSE
ncbi:hypothetical protein FOL47_006939 [Perkinsus chesapeaki]|uniref:EamA domain-containing protein n=1 Tax=Perkinsus chesapeaki TaxID=330153 RepID=A0A7J6N299_PERCH|nr:hypothetical protein FOL47_006939 [Perkinsus chesapeaki]